MSGFTRFAKTSRSISPAAHCVLSLSKKEGFVFAVLRRNLILGCALFSLISLAAKSASAQNLLSLQSGDNVIVSQNGTTGIYQGEPINNKISTYATATSSTYGAIFTGNNSTFVLQGGSIAENYPQYSIQAGLAAGGNVIISGGSISSTGVGLFDFGSNYVTISGGIISGNEIGLVADGLVTITGGTFSSAINGSSLWASNSSLVLISGGNFTTNIRELGGIIVISGGNFSGSIYNGGGYGGTIDLLGSSFTYTPDVYSSNSGISTTITSGIIPAGSGTITGTLANGQVLNTTYYSGGSASAGIMEVNANLPQPPTSPVWGTKVTVMLKGSPIPIVDRLVSFDGDNIVFAKDLEIDPNYDSVGVNNSFPLEDIESIKFTDPDDQKITSLLNKYILIQSDNTTITARLTGFSDDEFTFVKQFIPTKDATHDGHTPTETSPKDGILCSSAIAIPRVSGSDDPALTKTTLSAASFGFIPPHILYGLAWDESNWHQYYPQSNSNVISYQPGTTVVTYDGGIGLMQLTGATAAFLSDFSWDGHTLDQFPDDILSHIYGLASDTNYNAQAGARYLFNRFELTASKDPPTIIGDGSPMFLEHWLRAVNLYNGASPDHFTRIVTAIQTAPYEQGIEPVPVSSPKNVLAMPYPTFFPAHADVNFDGVIDLILQQPRSLLNKKDQILTITDLVIPKNSSTIISGDIYITDGNGDIVGQTPTTSFSSPQLAQVTIGGGIENALPKGNYTAHISVVLSTGEADGATYQFAI